MPIQDIRDDLPRTLALTDLLCGAASSDAYVAGEELSVVRAALLRLLALDELPPEVAAHIANFDPAAFDLDDALARLALESEEDRATVLEVVFDIVAADRFIDTSELGFVMELADVFGLPLPRALR
jgi:hypothetical protein